VIPHHTAREPARTIGAICSHAHFKQFQSANVSNRQTLKMANRKALLDNDS
jgi:hypothetical protein